MFLFRYVQAVDQRSPAFCPLEFEIARILRRSKLSGKTEFNYWQFNDLVRKYAFPVNIADLSVYVAAKTMILTRFVTILPFNTSHFGQRQIWTDSCPFLPQATQITQNMQRQSVNFCGLTGDESASH